MQHYFTQSPPQDNLKRLVSFLGKEQTSRVFKLCTLFALLTLGMNQDLFAWRKQYWHNSDSFLRHRGYHILAANQGDGFIVAGNDVGNNQTSDSFRCRIMKISSSDVLVAQRSFLLVVTSNRTISLVRT